MDQSEKCELFRRLHVPGDPFFLANVHDVGSAKMFAAMGAKAIATSSAAFAFTIGKPDMGHVSRDEMLDHCEDIVRAVDLPVQGDLENGYAHDPDGVAECIELADEVGLAGACIEDSTFEDGKPSYDFEVAVARIAAAVEAAEAMPHDFTLTARADGVMIGAYDVEEAIRRAQAFEEVGAHCIYVPLPPTMEDVATICASVSAPVNVLCAGKFTKYGRGDFAKAGAARISIGSALARATHRIILEAGHAMIDDGDFTALAKSVNGAEIDRLLKEGGAD
ncbi:MAG: isocitrate lyase/phosphoenolpyruvate mutase family protein [Ahrensia sp.]|nr:isocitrate lyase/phosphoenolpyruvate mutase family protein [Ahrensia sp.]